MANPTSNYGFVLPTSSDLVTDLPADFDVALQGVDTRLKALNPATTLGDLNYASATANTNTRLGIGSTGQVLTVTGGVPTWATAATPTSGLTLIATGTAAGTATSLAIDNCFTSTYRNYCVIINMRAASAGNFTFKFRAGGTDTSSGYCQAGYLIDSDAATLYAHIVNAGTAAQFRDVSTTDGYYVLEIGNPQIANRTGYFMTAAKPSGTNAIMSAATLSGTQSSTTQFDGINVINDTGNLTGTVRVYGYANS